MSRKIAPRTSVTITEEEAATRRTDDAKLLITTYKGQECALTLQENRLWEAHFFPETPDRIGAVYIGKVKNAVPNLNACFVEIADKEICFLPFQKTDVHYLLNRRFDSRILEGDEILVQVTRDAQKNKRASVTAEISLSNECFCLSFGKTAVRFSSKLSAEKREALTRLLTEKGMMRDGCLVQDCGELLSIAREKNVQISDLPPMGLIVRTRAGDVQMEEEHSMEEGRSMEEQHSDSLLASFRNLAAQFLELLSIARYRSCFSCLREAPDKYETVVQQFIAEKNFVLPRAAEFFRESSGGPVHPYPESGGRECSADGIEENNSEDLPSADAVQAPLADAVRTASSNAVQVPPAGVIQAPAAAGGLEIVTDQEPLYRRLLDVYGSIVKVRLYQDPLLPLSMVYSVNSKLEEALGRRVWLKSGGCLIIEPTEALTVIDVNSGKCESEKNPEDTYRKINLEAAREAAIQLRLRNLSGIIIIDFINMKSEQDRKTLLNYLKALVRRDRTQTTVVDMTPLGLVEITRRKGSRPLREQLTHQRRTPWNC